MKKALLFLFILISVNSGLLLAQSESDALLGVWESGSGKARVKIDKVSDKFFGKIVWLKEPNNEEGKPKVLFSALF
jgi:hypothetical protein